MGKLYPLFFPRLSSSIIVAPDVVLSAIDRAVCMQYLHIHATCTINNEAILRNSQQSDLSVTWYNAHQTGMNI